MNFIEPKWPAPPTIKAYTTTKQGFRKQKSDDRRQNTEVSAEENRKIMDLFNLSSEPIWINQTHSSIAIEAIPANTNKIADASYSNQPGNVCVVMTADCLPLLICSRDGTEIAAIHAGWRGLASGIIEETLSKLNRPADELLVWLGPAIGPGMFEVGRDVYEAFTSRHQESLSAFRPHSEGKWYADLYALAKIRLNLQGVSRIYGGGFCTYSQEDLFFSYRRDGKNTGRMASLIWISA